MIRISKLIKIAIDHHQKKEDASKESNQMIKNKNNENALLNYYGY